MKNTYLKPEFKMSEFQLEDVITASSETPVALTKTFDLSSDSVWVADDGVINFDFNS